MKTNSITRYFFVLFLALVLWGCKKDLLEPTNEDFKVKSFISNIKSYNVNSEYDENIMPTDTNSADKPYVSVQSWVIKGKDILMSITVPDDAEELYFGAINSQAEYMGLNFEGQDQNNAIGYYRLKLRSIPNPETASNGLINYQVVLSSNENIQIDKFDLLVSCKTTKGISNKVSVPVNVASIAPYQKNLKVGFRPLTGYTYTIKVSTPSGTQITYSYNKNTGTETFNNSQVPNASLSYDSGLDFKWIDFSDPEFGGYSMTATIQIDLTGGTQYIYLYLAIITEGKIDQVNLNANIQQTGQNTAVGTANVGFSYFDEMSVKVKMTVYRQQTPYFHNTVVPDNQKISPGVGIRYNGDNKSKNLIRVDLMVNPIVPPDGVTYVLKRNNKNINVWADSAMTTPILNLINQADINFNSNIKTIYIENSSFGSSSLEFIALKNNTAISSDNIVFNSFRSIVLMIGGNSVDGIDAKPGDLTQGVFRLAVELYNNQGYDVYQCAEDDGSGNNNNFAFNIIMEAFNNRKVTNAAIVGYSHGGGATCNIAARLNGIVDIPFTAYIDAIQQGNSIWAEKRIPCYSKVHLNFYHGKGAILNGTLWDGNLCGYFTPLVSETNVNTTSWGQNLDHSTIHTNPTVLNQIELYLKTWVNR